MKKVLWICLIVAAAVWLSGCTIISFEESGHTKRLCAVYTPSQGILRVVHVPCPDSPPRPSQLLE